MNRFIDHLQVVTISNYYTTADLHTINHFTLSLYFHCFLLSNSSPQWLFFCSVVTRRLLVTNLSNADSSASVARWLTLHSWTIISTACSVNFLQVKPSAWPPRKTLSSVVKNACLLARYPAMDICEPHREHLLRRWFYYCVRVFLILPRNGLTCHNINLLFVQNKEFLNVEAGDTHCINCPLIS
jgi:hypothetical protein